MFKVLSAGVGRDQTRVQCSRSMCRKATAIWVLGLAAAGFSTAVAQDARVAGRGVEIEWRHTGNAAVDLGLPSVATGAVSRVWYSADGAKLFALTATGHIFETSDFEQWRTPEETVSPMPEASATAATLPETAARTRPSAARAGRLYAFANQVYRSDDGGHTWSGVTEYRSASILGAPVTDLAASPQNPDELTVANAYGVWRSVDGGLSWTGLNDFLPNLNLRRLLATPSGPHGLLAAPSRDSAAVYEWAPGEKTAWRPAPAPEAFITELAMRRQLSQALSSSITAVAYAGDYVYAGSSDGRIWSSSDQGRTWRISGNPDEAGRVESIFLDPKDPRTALAAMGLRVGGANSKASHVRRTQNGGVFWDDMTSNLPDVAAHGITADVPSGTVYVATGAGVFYTTTDLLAAGPAPSWAPLPGLPEAPANDIRLDSGNNQVWVAVDGYGVYSTLAPHRFRNIGIVSAADYSRRPAAPGSLLSVLGAKLDSARSANLAIPVFGVSAAASQIQVPFEATGPVLPLTLESAARRIQQTIPLQPVSPGIFVDPDGAPMLLDAETGILLDTSQPARPGSRIQIFATGLGRVQPDWPAGLPAPLQNPPKVMATVHAYLGGEPLTVSRAELAPSYIGFYLIEVELPKIVNAGPAELYIEADGQLSNRVRIYLEP